MDVKGAHKYPSVFDTPAQQAKYEKLLAEVENKPEWKALMKELRDSERITEKDLAIVINAR